MRQCDIETPDDFRRYYSAGWFGIAGKDGTILPYTCAPSGEGKSVTIYSIQKLGDDENTYIPAALEKIDWMELREKAIFGCPELGMVKSMGTVMYGARIAERNSRRGLSPQRLIFHDFNLWDLRTKYGGVPPPTAAARYDIVWNYFNPYYHSFTEAFNKLEDGIAAGAVLNPHYALYTSSRFANPVLAYKRWTVGFAERFRIYVHRRFREYQEQVSNLCRTEVQLV